MHLSGWTHTVFKELDWIVSTQCEPKLIFVVRGSLEIRLQCTKNFPAYETGADSYSRCGDDENASYCNELFIC